MSKSESTTTENAEQGVRAMTQGVYETAVEIMKAAGITPRPRQLDLLQFLSDGGARYVQAPTGVGKSFAAIAHAAANAELTGDPSIIIAADNTLLDQYANKDLRSEERRVGEECR